jgi:hypothetical protein
MLSQNYPNPFNPTTAISYSLLAVSQVRVTVYDLLGREVAVLVNERKNAGTFSVQWNASGLASGIKFCILQAGTFRETKRMMIVK